jgi:predicted component of type VI protein secretion system
MHKNKLKNENKNKNKNRESIYVENNKEVRDNNESKETTNKITYSHEGEAGKRRRGGRR